MKECKGSRGTDPCILTSADVSEKHHILPSILLNDAPVGFV